MEVYRKPVENRFFQVNNKSYNLED